jgi:hypothetical protein
MLEHNPYIVRAAKRLADEKRHSPREIAAAPELQGFVAKSGKPFATDVVGGMLAVGWADIERGTARLQAHDLSMACVSKLYALIPIRWRRPAPTFPSRVLPLAIARPTQRRRNKKVKNMRSIELEPINSGRATRRCQNGRRFGSLGNGHLLAERCGTRAGVPRDHY